MNEYETRQKLREGLESANLVPLGIRARIIEMQPLLGATPKHVPIDAIVEFTVDKQTSKPITAIIEVKSRLSPMILEGVIHQLLGYRNELCKTGTFDDLYPMVAAPYISDSVQARCKELGVGYIDLNGTFALIHDGIYVDVVRPATVFKNPQGIKNLFSGRSRRIIRVLLANPHTPYRLEELAAQTQLSTGQAFQVARRMEEDGFLDRTSKGRVLTKPRKLLRLFAEQLKSDYARNRSVFTGFSEMPPTEFSRFLSETCERKGVRCAFTLASGLEPYERNVREDITAAYINVLPTETFRNELRLEAVGKGANAFLMTPPEPDNTDAGGVFYHPRNLSTGLTGVNPVQLYADFTLHGSRGQEQADFLAEHALGFRD